MSPQRREYSRHVLAVMVGINLLNYLDRYVLPSAARQIKAEFHLTDSAVGLLETAFPLVFALDTIPPGIWPDRGVRETIMGIGPTIRSFATLFTGLARNYVQLFLVRASLGLGETSHYPTPLGPRPLGDIRSASVGRPSSKSD